MALDWDHLRRHRYSPDAPPREWRSDIRPISLEGLSLLGLDPVKNELYWDGQQIVLAKRLALFERTLATIATMSAAIVAAVEVLRAFALAS